MESRPYSTSYQNVWYKYELVVLYYIYFAASFAYMFMYGIDVKQTKTIN